MVKMVLFSANFNQILTLEWMWETEDRQKEQNTKKNHPMRSKTRCLVVTTKDSFWRRKIFLLQYITSRGGRGKWGPKLTLFYYSNLRPLPHKARRILKLTLWVPKKSNIFTMIQSLRISVIHPYFSINDLSFSPCFVDFVSFLRCLLIKFST